MSSISTSFFGGVKLAFIDQKLGGIYRDLDSESPEADFYKGCVDMNAYGLYVGTECLHDICSICNCGQLGIFGNISMGALVGCFDRKVRVDTLTDNIINIKENNSHCLVGNVNLSAGFSYSLPDCMCGNWMLCIGYEMHLWLNTIDFLTINQNNNENEFDPSRNTDAVGFDGLFVRASVCF